MSFSFSQKKHSSGARLMTEGNIAKQLILFALPLLVGNLFQQLYNTVDSIVVGNYVSKTALAAVGSTDCIINTIIGFFSGLSTGAGVVISTILEAAMTKHFIVLYIPQSHLHLCLLSSLRLQDYFCHHFFFV